MKKNSKKSEGPEVRRRTVTIGMDLGDRTSRYCVLEDGEVVKQASVATTKKGLAQTFGGRARCRIAIEAGTHSPWVSRQSPDTDLRRWGSKLAERGGKNAKKRAVVAVARKLSILLHRLWVSGEVYEPLRQAGAQRRVAA